MLNKPQTDFIVAKWSNFSSRFNYHKSLKQKHIIIIIFKILYFNYNHNIVSLLLHNSILIYLCIFNYYI